MKEISYEVFAINAYGSDIYTTYDKEDALKQAQEWSMNSIDTDIIINEIKTTKIKTFRNGGEVA